MLVCLYSRLFHNRSTINGHEGNDSLYGNNDNDIINGGDDNDIIDGGAGNDNMKGEMGDDTYVVNAARDVVTETADAGIDSVQSAVTHTLGANLENLTLTGTNAINGTGNGLNNFLTGNAADNTLNAGLGEDYVNGGVDNDANDLLIVDYSSNPYTGEYSGVNGGVYSGEGTQGDFSGSFGAYNSESNYDLVNFDNIDRFKITGTKVNDRIYTAAGNDTINGGAGDDWINGGEGINTIDGGAGNDQMSFGNFGAATTDLLIDDNPTTTEAIALADGTSVKNIESFETLITGSGEDEISYSQRSYGDISTGEGDDTINPGLGYHYVVGGTGTNAADDDLLIIDYSSKPYNGTNPHEYGLSSSAHNTAPGETSGSFNAYDSDYNGEGISFENINRFQITGTKISDRIWTAEGNDTINGGAGDDQIDGGAGINTIDGGAGKDKMSFGNFEAATTNLVIDNNPTTADEIALADGTSVKNIESFDNLTTGSGDDEISYSQRSYGNISTGEGDDTINAGLGYHYVDGGTGTNAADNDLLIVDYSSKTYNGTTQYEHGLRGGVYNTAPGEFSGGFDAYDSDYNNDFVNFENINRFQITGTAVADSIFTAAGDDTINGGAGDDTIIIDKAGNDILTGGDGNDSFVYNTYNEFTTDSFGVSDLTDFASGDDKIVLSKDTFTALTSIAGAGFSKASEFAVVGDDADVATADALIVYSSGSDSLFYNQNGADPGLGSGDQFATGIADLSSADFVIQGYEEY